MLSTLNSFIVLLFKIKGKKKGGCEGNKDVNNWFEFIKDLIFR